MNKIPFNPFDSEEEFKTKKPKDMTIEELEILLHAKRLNLKLDVERLEKKINYTKLLFSVIRATKISEIVENLFVSNKTSK
jgi:hypothetical protein